VLHLENPIQNYAWGSHSAISTLLGAATPSAKPEAELWLGAHPQAPSLVLPSREPLCALIERAPERTLGARNQARFGPRLPFLLKVLAAETPLSLQAHPTLEQARAGFDAEQARGVPLDAPERNYKDRNHKPELLCALTPFSALCGFRRIEESCELLGALKLRQLGALLDVLAKGPSDVALSQVVATLLSLPLQQRRELARAVLDRCTELAPIEGRFQHEYSWAVRLGVLYPGDIGIVNALLLNLIHLSPGEAIYLPAGNLHAYLHGVGIELMANSDNVLRGGLTPKHVDPTELLRVLKFQAGPVTVLTGDPSAFGKVYRTEAAEFELEQVTLSAAHELRFSDRRGPEILLCQDGELEVHCNGAALALARGQAVFVAAEEPEYGVRGEGVLFRASVGRF